MPKNPHVKKVVVIGSGPIVHGFLALALQSAGTRIPKRWSARQLAGELRHSPVHRDASHDGSFSILVHSALF